MKFKASFSQLLTFHLHPHLLVHSSQHHSAGLNPVPKVQVCPVVAESAPEICTNYLKNKIAIQNCKHLYFRIKLAIANNLMHYLPSTLLSKMQQEEGKLMDQRHCLHCIKTKRLPQGCSQHPGVGQLLCESCFFSWSRIFRLS